MVRTGDSLAVLVEKRVNDSDWDEETFRANVENALEHGSFILMIIVDAITEELARIVPGRAADIDLIEVIGIKHPHQHHLAVGAGDLDEAFQAVIGPAVVAGHRLRQILEAFGVTLVDVADHLPVLVLRQEIIGDTVIKILEQQCFGRSNGRGDNQR